jgi:EmrB/QacA subfamily drug resistance transporter
VADEELHPLGKRLIRGHALQEFVSLRAQDVDLMPVHGLDQRLARGEMAVEGADANTGSAGDVLERHVCAPSGKRVGGRGEQEVAVAHGVGARPALRGRGGSGLDRPTFGYRDFLDHHCYEPHLQNGDSLRILTGAAVRFLVYAIWRFSVPPTATLVSPPQRATERQSRRGLVLAIILAVQLMVVLDATIVNIALPDIAGALHFSPANLSWVITAYTLAFGGFLLLGARAGDLLGRRRVFIAGIAVFTAASLLGGLAPWSGWLLAARALQGVGGALAAPSALALLMTMFRDGQERVRAIGWYTAVSIGGGAIGLILGGLLVQWVSWRWVLFVNVPIGIVVIALARRLLTETPSRNGHFDVRGALTSTIGVTSLAYGFVRAATSGWGDATTMVAFAVGIALLVTFVFLERRAPEPITPLRLFADRSRSASYVARLFLTAGMFGMFFFLTQFLQEVLHYGPLETGLAFLPFTLALFAMSQLSARRLVQRFGAKPIMVIGFTVSTLGMLLMTQLAASSNYVSLLAPLLLFGAGNGLAFVPLTSTSLSGVRQEEAGAASGLVNVMQQLGGALGLAVLVSVFGTAARGAAAQSVAVAQHGFVVGADHAFIAATLFVGATVVVLGVAIRGRRAAVRAEAVSVPAWVREIEAPAIATPEM